MKESKSSSVHSNVTSLSNPNDGLPLDVPHDIAVCPICASNLFIEEIQDWIEDNGKIRIDPQITNISVNCDTEPDIDSDEWPDWMRGHWSTPYIDWLPVQQRVTRWLAEKWNA